MNSARNITKHPLGIAIGAATLAVGAAAMTLSTFSAHADEDSAGEGTPLETTPVAVSDAGAGERTAVPMKMRGTTDLPGIVMHVSDFGDLPYDSDYTNCGSPDEEPGGFLCVWPDLTIAEGDVYQVDSGTPIGFSVGDSAPGPIDLCRLNGGCSYSVEAMGVEDAEYWLRYIGGDMTEPAELVPGDDDSADEWGQRSDIAFTTAENPADVEVPDARVDGEVGDQVTLRVEPTNRGTADWIAPTSRGDGTLKITLPGGVKVIDPAGCQTDGERQLSCAVEAVSADSTPYREFVVEIVDAASADDGEIFFDTEPPADGLYDVNLDPNQDNNRAAIALNAAA